MLGQIHHFDVYVANGDQWVRHNATSPLVGRFCHNTLNAQLQVLPVRERGTDLAARRLQYPAGYDMPDGARIYWLDDPTAGGAVTVWNVTEDTEAMWHGIGGFNVVQTVQVNRIDQVG